jgi:hypothetical protein
LSTLKKTILKKKAYGVGFPRGLLRRKGRESLGRRGKQELVSPPPEPNERKQEVGCRWRCPNFPSKRKRAQVVKVS